MPGRALHAEKKPKKRRVESRLQTPAIPGRNSGFTRPKCKTLLKGPPVAVGSQLFFWSVERVQTAGSKRTATTEDCCNGRFSHNHHLFSARFPGWRAPAGAKKIVFRKSPRVGICAAVSSCKLAVLSQARKNCGDFFSRTTHCAWKPPNIQPAGAGH